MMPSDQLLLVRNYITEAREDLIEAAEHNDPYVRTAKRKAIKDRLEAVRELLKELEDKYPDTAVSFTDEDGFQGEHTVSGMRMWALVTEAEVLGRCYEDWKAAQELGKRAVAINPRIADTHVMLGGFYALDGNYPAAIEAFERAIELKPDDLSFKQFLNDTRREAARVEADRAEAAKKSGWGLRRWLS